MYRWVICKRFINFLRSFSLFRTFLQSAKQLILMKRTFITVKIISETIFDLLVNLTVKLSAAGVYD